jgi:hypothetical protein
MIKPLQIIIAVFVTYMFVFTAAADSKNSENLTGPVVSVNAPDTVSGTFDAVIEIKDVTNLDSGQFDLSFDPNVISVVDVKPGRIESTDVPVDMWHLIDDGRIRILFNLPDTTGVSGSGKLAKINFEVTGSVGNTSVLAISNGSLVNTSALDIPANWTDDEITVVAPVEVTVTAPDTVSGTFDAVINITNVTNLDSAQFDLSFNGDVVNVTGVDPGSIGTAEIPVDDWSFIDNNTIRVLINLPETAGVSGSGSLATIHFTATGSTVDNCTLDISDGLLVDTDAVPIYALWFDLEIEGITTGIPVSVNAPETVSGTFNATIDITNVVNLDSGQFDISFDANVVNVTGVDSGNIDETEIRLESWTFMDSDTIRVLFNLPGATGVSGSGSLAAIHFTVTGTTGDTSVLDISDGLLVDIEADEIPSTWIDDEVSV